uniref:Ig-like domain-containing protein n=1 Tax=Naja naja TaxID=35670 RepID=A0A8C7E391_NAJNA
MLLNNLYPPSFVKKVDPSYLLTPGESARLQCKCEISGTPPFDITWYKDKRQIRSSKKYKVTSKNYLANIHILNTETSDIGEYQCKAKNDVGSDTCICTVSFPFLNIILEGLIGCVYSRAEKPFHRVILISLELSSQ